MGVKCFLKNCTKVYNNKHGTDVSYHRFPMKDLTCYQRWVQAIPENLLDLPLPEYSYICSLHFCHTSYQPFMLTSKNILCKDAYPTLFYTEESNEDNTEKNFETENIPVNMDIQVPAKSMTVSEEKRLPQKEVLEKFFLLQNNPNQTMDNYEIVIVKEEIQTVQELESSLPLSNDACQIAEQILQKFPDSSREKNDFNWSHEAIVALLDEYKQHGHLITPKKQTKQLWTIICSQLVEKGHNITASQCKRKLAGLKSTYENVKSRSAQSNNTNQTWQYFDIMDELFKKKTLMVPVVTLDSSNPNLSFCENIDSDKRSLDSCNNNNTEPPLKRLKQIGEGNWKDIGIEKVIAIMKERAIGRKKIHEEAMARLDKLLDILGKILNKFDRSSLSSPENEFTSKHLKQSEENYLRNTLQKIAFVAKVNANECTKMYEEMKDCQTKLLYIVEKIFDKL